MSQILRHSTACVTAIGPFVDFTDGATSEEALTVTNAEIFLSKNGGGAGAKNDATDLGHLNGGMYSLTLDTSDTDTVGRLDVIINDTANDARPVMGHYQIIEEAIYDALYVASADGFNASGQVNLLTATQASIDAIETGTVTDATGTNIAADIIAMDANVDQIETAVITNASGADVATDVVAIAALLTTEVADILALLDDARTEPGQGAPPVNPDAMTKLDYLYKAWRNKVTQTATEYKLFANDGTTTDQKSTISDDGSTFTRSEIGTGA